jgi:hypothetical protein
LPVLLFDQLTTPLQPLVVKMTGVVPQITKLGVATTVGFADSGKFVIEIELLFTDK